MHWFDIREGKMVVGDAAYESVIEQSGPGDIVPLADLLVEPDLTVDYTDFDHLPRRMTPPSEEECRTYGAWVLNLLSEADDDYPLERSHFERLSRLGLGMTYSAFRKGIGINPIAEIRAELGNPHFSPPLTYDDWSTEDFVENAKKLALALKRKPIETDYREWARQNKGPGLGVIQTRIEGGVRRLNEMAGYFNSNDATDQDFIDWGVHVMEANESALPTVVMVSVLSKRDRGPSHRTLADRFGTMTDFQQRVKQEYELTFGAHDREEPEISRQEAQAIVIKACTLGLTDKVIDELAQKSTERTLISNIRKINPNLHAGDIESLAVTYGVFDIIWPLSKGYQHLRVSDEDLDAERSVATLRKQRWRDANNTH
jgi:hypothetical protein